MSILTGKNSYPLSLKVSYTFLSGFSLTDTNKLWDTGDQGLGGNCLYSTLLLPLAHKRSDIYLQLCIWEDYHVFWIAPLVATRLQLDKICHLLTLPFDWLMMECLYIFCLPDRLTLDFVTKIVIREIRWF